MLQPPAHPRDPLGWTVLVTLGFALLCAIRLTIPSRPFFDEIHYLPAARAVLDLSHAVNVEHPPLGKQLIALGMALFGDRALGWRVMSALFGVLAMFAAMRAMWFASLSRFATIAFGVLLATAAPLLIQSRIAMLDIFMCSFVMVAMWMSAGALRENETARWRLAVAGVAIGCALASKWNALPIALLPGLTFLVVRIHSAGWRFLTTRRGAPIGGITLPEAALWLGVVPLAVYAAAYWPFFFFEKGAISPLGLVELHQKMLRMQESVIKHHTYQSVWYQWVGNWRAIWYYYEVGDGAQRGVLLVGNPLTMLIGLPAVLWCAWMGLRRQRWDALAVFVLYAATLGLWIVSPKPVQFYYHYLLPSCFLMAALALALDGIWRLGGKWRRVPLAVLALACALFVYFWPIYSAAPLHGGKKSYEHFTWLRSWR